MFSIKRIFICFTLLVVLHAACHQHRQDCDERNDICQEYQHNLYLYNGTCVDECLNDYIMNTAKKYYHENKTCWFVVNISTDVRTRFKHLNDKLNMKQA